MLLTSTLLEAVAEVYAEMALSESSFQFMMLSRADPNGTRTITGPFATGVISAV